MQTKAEKQRKLKIISLIIICNFVKAQKQPPVTIEDHIDNVLEFHKWIFEMEKITTPIPRREPGMVVHNQKEPIMPK